MDWIFVRRLTGSFMLPSMTVPAVAFSLVSAAPARWSDSNSGTSRIVRLLASDQTAEMPSTCLLLYLGRAAWLACAICALTLPIVPPAHAVPLAENPLAAERWQTRPIVVVVPASDRALLRRIEAALERTATREAFVSREIVLYSVEAGEGRRSGVALTTGQTRALLGALKLESDGPPTLVLVGLDGSVKMVKGNDVDLHEVLAVIDRMPMRQRQR